MADGKQINVELRMIDEEFKRALDGAKARVKEFDKTQTGIAGSLKGLSAASAIFYGTIGTAAYKCVTAASDLQEQTSKFNTVFGSQQQIAEQWADTLVSGYAMSTREAKQNLAAMMDLLEPMGMNAEAAAKMSFEVVKLSADLGSFNNVPTAQVMADLQSALVGNYETTKKYGVVLNETVIKEEARRQGIIKGKEELTATQKAEVAYSLILKGSKNALGDMARTQDSYANAQKKLKAQIEDMSASIGNSFLPMAGEMIKSVSDLISIAGQVSSAFGDIGISVKKMTGPMAALAAYNKWALDGLKQITGYNLSASTSLNELNSKTIAGTQKTTTETKKATGAQIDAYAKLLEQRKSMERDLLKSSYEALGMKEEVFNLEYQQAIEAADKIGVAREKVDAAYAIKRQQMQGQEIADFNSKYAQPMLGFAQNMVGQLGTIFEMGTQARMQKVENEYNKNLETISALYEIQKANIENTIGDKKERDAALKALDEKRAREEKFITEQAEKTKRKLARESAEKQRSISIVSAIMTAAQGSVAAFAGGIQTIPVPIYAGMILGGVMASIMTAFGIAQAAMIARQPLPAAAAGIFATGPYVMGEKGNEIAYPLDGREGKNAMRWQAEQLLNALEERYAKGDKKPIKNEGQIVSSSGQAEQVTLYRVAPMSREAFFADLFEASRNGELFISKRGVQ